MEDHPRAKSVVQEWGVGGSGLARGHGALPCFEFYLWSGAYFQAPKREGGGGEGGEGVYKEGQLLPHDSVSETCVRIARDAHAYICRGYKLALIASCRFLRCSGES